MTIEIDDCLYHCQVSKKMSQYIWILRIVQRGSFSVINSLLIVFLNERLIRYPESSCGNSNQVLVSVSQGTHPTILGQLDKMALSHSLWPSDWSIWFPSRPLIGQEETIEPIVTLTITLLNNCMVSKIWGGGGEICFILSEIRSVCEIQWALSKYPKHFFSFAEKLPAFIV